MFALLHIQVSFLSLMLLVPLVCPFQALDSGVTDHMMHSLEKFSTYILCPSNKKTTTADGSSTIVTC